MAQAAAPLPTVNPWSAGASNQYVSPYAGMSMGTNNMVPTAPQFNQPWNSSMAEAPVLAGMLNGVNYNTQPLSNVENYASNPNASPWATAATENANNQKTQAENQLVGQEGGQEATARGNLAREGGLSSGAGERIATEGERAAIGGEQGIASTNMTNLNQIGINDASNKLQAQEALPGMETQAYQAQLEPIQMYGQAYGQDVANNMNNANSLNQFNMGLYQNQGQIYGSSQQAAATANSGGSSCWLITAIVERGGAKRYTGDAELLEKLKMYFGAKYKRYAIFYLKDCGKLIDKMVEHDYDFKKIKWFQDSIIHLMSAGEIESAARLFISTITSLVDTYWEDCPNKAFAMLKKERDANQKKMHSLKCPKDVNPIFTSKCLTNLEVAQ